MLLDEITSAWRMDTGGMQMVYGIEPDMATYAKTISHGVPMAAVIGRKKFMNAAQKTFISSAYWTERLGPAAALATLKKHRALDGGKILAAIGAKVQAGWKKAAAEHGLLIHALGLSAAINFVIKHEESLALQTLFTQQLLRRGFLANERFCATLGHTKTDVAEYLKAVNEAFSIMAFAIKKRKCC